MERERPNITQTDHSVPGAKAEAGGQAVNIRLVGFDRPFFTAFAVVLALVAAVASFYTEFREERRVYFTQRCEAFLEMAVTHQQTVVPYQICGPRDGDNR